MMNLKLRDMKAERLIDLFANNSIEQDNSLKIRDIKKVNQLIKQMMIINDELKSRGEEIHLKLLDLYNHKNFQVRLQAARMTLTVAPIAARQEIEAIAKSRHYPQAGDAGMILAGIDGKFGVPG